MKDSSRLLDARKEEEDITSELSLRPKTLKEYIGQTEMKDNLKVFMGAAKKRKESLDHVLLYGPPGLGKLRWPMSLLMKWVAILS